MKSEESQSEALESVVVESELPELEELGFWVGGV